MQLGLVLPQYGDGALAVHSLRLHPARRKCHLLQAQTEEDSD
jgi:hypothetical protein